MFSFRPWRGYYSFGVVTEMWDYRNEEGSHRRGTEGHRASQTDPCVVTPVGPVCFACPGLLSDCSLGGRYIYQVQDRCIRTCTSQEYLSFLGHKLLSLFGITPVAALRQVGKSRWKLRVLLDLCSRILVMFRRGICGPALSLIS